MLGTIRIRCCGFVGLALLAIGCKSRDQKGSAVKYQVGNSYDVSVLLPHVHDEYLVWKANPECMKSKNVGDDFVNNAISQWLNALADAGKAGKVNLKTPKIAIPINEDKYNKEKLGTNLASLFIRFNCEIGRSYVESERQTVFLYLSEMQADSGSMMDDMMTVEAFSYNTLLHELGHMIGLQDVYTADNPQKAKGNQPRSVMNGGVDGYYTSKKVSLTQDDIDGLIHLYNYYVLEIGDLKTCPVGYVKDPNAEGYTGHDQKYSCVKSGEPVF
ncbi:MAG: hypothetical protein AB7T49_04265 [Oligoflexales bacterium]